MLITALTNWDCKPDKSCPIKRLLTLLLSIIIDYYHLFLVGYYKKRNDGRKAVAFKNTVEKMMVYRTIRLRT